MWLSETMQGAVSEYQRRSVKERSARGQADAVARGAVPWSRVALGYRRLEDGRFESDPATVPIVQRAYEMRADGATMTRVRAMLLEARRRAVSQGRAGDARRPHLPRRDRLRQARQRGRARADHRPRPVGAGAADGRPSGPALGVGSTARAARRLAVWFVQRADDGDEDAAPGRGLRHLPMPEATTTARST